MTANAQVTTQISEKDGYDIGLHAESEAGDLEVGVALTPQGALGVMLNAPQVGRLMAAFALDDRGATHLVQLSRTGADGQTTPVIVDADRSQFLEAELQNAHKQWQTAQARLEVLTSQVDEARARAAALQEDAQAYQTALAEEQAAAQRQVQAAETQLASVKAELASSQAEKIKVVGEREAITKLRDEVTASLVSAKAEAESLKVQLAGTSVKAESLSEAEQALKTLRDQLAARTGEAEELKGKIEKQKLTIEEQKTRLDTLEAETDHAKAEADRFKVDIQILKNDVEEAQKAAKTVVERGPALKAAEARIADQVDELRALKAEHDNATKELEELFARGGLDPEQAATLQSELQANQEALAGQEKAAEQTIAERDEARELVKKLKVSALELLAERDEARAVARSLHAKPAAPAPPAGPSAEVEALQAELAAMRPMLETDKTTISRQKTELQKSQLQIDSLGRQLENERTARAKASTERDEYKERFMALTNAGDVQSNSTIPPFIEERVITKSYKTITLPKIEPDQADQVKTDPGDMQTSPHGVTFGQDDKKKKK
jgi:chromosome segregation ATPase